MAYLFNTSEDVHEMLSVIGASSIDSLFDCIPPEARFEGELKIPAALSEIELTRRMEQLASRNQGVGQAVCFLGGGAYDHFIPAVVDALASRGEFYTSYTPYQPEVSQGNLQVMFEYETLICQLTGMDVSNASLYDGASATIEAVLLAMASRPKCSRVVVASSLHPEYRQVLETYLQWTRFELVTVDCPDGNVPLAEWQESLDESVGCVVLSQPNFFGVIEDLTPHAEAAKASGAVVVAVCDMISLGMFASPAQWGADIVVGEGQALGNPLQFGGPYLGIMACREAFVRRMPGRIAGQTEDRQGQRCWVLTLQTREQHIRRDRATSNICTNQGLFALRAAIYLALQGPQGLRETAEQCAWKMHYLETQLAGNERFEVRFHGSSWREIVVRDRQQDVPGVLAHCQQHGMLAGLDLGRWYPEFADCFMIAVTEKRTRAELDQLLQLLVSSSHPTEVAHA
ncbi:aminomethyl-transferring glycine dehydrogenase subunit GcvPA [Aureliella helgolandensis]|uniref:Probable glycine dehydrogenase (decarboxylating) subunit 1 n=1 Tax=Aureliella helgolandensis TaxID=2527968 RepID=A0A518GEZ8_9BACT|nr:aminomethyl-transferring glycine dehydrogenase subunit GcvPA [Aureliella helgolandensis]QDV27174.1 putative glycine dehydrogenase (decarboxylating) subunit 1 [Aureliella helgolandensis]